MYHIAGGDPLSPGFDATQHPKVTITTFEAFKEDVMKENWNIAFQDIDIIVTGLGKGQLFEDS